LQLATSNLQLMLHTDQLMLLPRPELLELINIALLKRVHTNLSASRPVLRLRCRQLA